MTRRKVFLHIGLPGTGAAFVEQALLSHATGLSAVGVEVASNSTEEMLRAAVEIRRDHKDWGYRRSEVEGTWSEICRRIFRAKCTSVVSQELLAAADADQIALFLDGLSGREVHLVLTVRDPGTQVTAGWQETVESGDSVTFARFHERIMDPDRTHAQARRFWNAQDLVEVLARWGRIKPQRIHVIAVPQETDPRAAVWKAFGDIVGFDASRFAPDMARDKARDMAWASRPILGTTEVAVLRGVNEAIDGRIEGQLRRTVVKRYFADRILGDTTGTPATTPPESYDELLVRSDEWHKLIANAGYDVHGELDDLFPRSPTKSAVSPDDVPLEARLRTTTNALANVLVEVARLREHNEQLEIRNAKLVRKRKKLKRRLAETELIS